MKSDKTFNYKKKYGQNFLQDNNILDNIIRESGVSNDTLVIEIGVGKGALTNRLCEKAKNVLGYEIDLDLKDYLDNSLSRFHNLEIVYEDFLNRNVKKDISKYEYKCLMVVANLPYYITTPIIMKLINESIPVDKMVLMVQKEVADRFGAKINSKSYNSLTVFLNYYYNISKAFVVSRNCFYPQPNVDSAVVVFEKKHNSYNVIDEALFFKIVKDAFRQKRKTLKNNLYNYDLKVINKVLEVSGKNINFRAESITIDEFVAIANSLSKKDSNGLLSFFI